MSLVLTCVIVQFNLSTLYYSKPWSNFQLCYLLHTPTQQRMAMALPATWAVDGPLDWGGCGLTRKLYKNKWSSFQKDLSSTFNWPLTETVEQVSQNESRKVLHKQTVSSLSIPLFSTPRGTWTLGRLWSMLLGWRGGHVLVSSDSANK